MVVATLEVIGRRDDDKCRCGSAQNAAHLLQWPLIGDGKGRPSRSVMRTRTGTERYLVDFLS